MVDNNLANKITDVYRLTSLQEGMLYHNLISNSNGEYVNQYVLHSTDNNINILLVRKAIQLLALKHEVLRSKILYDGLEVPIQVILNEYYPECVEVDISKEEDVERAVSTLRLDDINRGFDLQQDTLFRATLVKISEQAHKLIFTIHHIIEDGWSINILLQSFFEIYSKLRDGEEYVKVITEIENNKKSSSTYGDFVRWLTEQDQEEGLKYWIDFLDNYEQVADFMPVGERKEVEEGVSEVSISLSEDITKRIEEVSKSKDVTVNTFVEVALGIVMQRYNNTNDVVFGKVVSGRGADITRIEDIVGLFINTIPQRIKCDENITVIELLKKVQRKSIDSTEYEFIGLPEIQNGVSLRGNLFKTILAYENYYVDESVNLKDSKGDFNLETAREQTNYDISFMANISENLHLKAIYKKAVYEKKEIELLLERYENVLIQMVSNLGMKVSKLDVLSKSEKKLVVEKFNSTYECYSKSKCIHELFEIQVDKTPNKTAVIYDGNHITYSELNRKSNQLARKLRNEGIETEEFVALITERSIEMIVGIYGVVKSGAAYVPIDVEYPIERIMYILEDCKAKVVLVGDVSNEIVMRIEMLGIKVISLLDSSVYSGNAINLKNITKIDNLLYLIYTSGTTGRPKGVMVEHGGVINRILWMQKEFPTNYDDTILQKTTYSFDVSVWEIFWWGITGASAVLLKQGDEKDAQEIVSSIKMNKVSVVHFVPSMFKVFLNYISTDNSILQDISTLKFIFLSGEPLETDSVNEFHLLLVEQKARLINLYGPTEASIDVTFYDCYEKNSRKIPIGKPISNTQIFIKDNYHNTCGIGLPGELCIAGDGVARGYLNRKTLTDEKFVNNEYGKGKLYATGDLARWLPDGNIEYLGRIDEQVKIRGFRIELGEIESIIRKCDYVQDVVVVIQGSNDEKKIYAYLVSSYTLDLNKITSVLEKKIPAYMIPTGMMQIDEIPKTKNGKLDRQALPNIVLSQSKYIKSRNEVEEILVRLFEEILGIEKVSVSDNFFELGGNSIKAMQVAVRMKQAGYKITLKDLMKGAIVENIVKKLM